MSAGRAVLRAPKNLGSPLSKPSCNLYILNELYDSECSGTDDDEEKILRREIIGVSEKKHVTKIEEGNDGKILII